MKEKIILLIVLAILATTTIASAYLPEDLNEDGIVNIEDIAQVAEYFGSEPGHSRWNAEADINGDEIVNIIDVVLVAKQFGKTE